MAILILLINEADRSQTLGEHDQRSSKIPCIYHRVDVTSDEPLDVAPEPAICLLLARPVG